MQDLYADFSSATLLTTLNVEFFPWPMFAHKLIEAAFLDYARLLRSLGLREGAALWASRAGTAGEQLMEELFQGEGGSPETIFGKEQVQFVQESTEWSQWPWSWHVVKSARCLFNRISLRLCKFTLYQLLWTRQSINEDYLRKISEFFVCVYACLYQA